MKSRFYPEKAKPISGPIAGPEAKTFRGRVRRKVDVVQIKATDKETVMLKPMNVCYSPSWDETYLRLAFQPEGCLEDPCGRITVYKPHRDMMAVSVCKRKESNVRG